MRLSLKQCLIAVAAMLVGQLARAAALDPAAADYFEQEVRPLLLEHCATCHGGEVGKKPKGNLSLQSRALLLQGGDNGPAAMAGEPEKSLIVEAVRYRNPDMQMPPDGRLTDKQVAVVEKWVAMGLPWPESQALPVAVAASAPGKQYQFTEAQRKFWAFQPVRVAAAPAVREQAWAVSDLDRYVLAGLEAKNLKPALPVEKRALIRRATFDLIGLPPTPAEVEAFVADQAPDAYAKVVDRLLASPAYGEKWGRHWLDLVRYADSRDVRDLGAAYDISESWRYRDYVIKAFNRDEPYDQFIKEQIAGDLMPSKDPNEVNADGIVATGMLCIGSWGGGDSDYKKMHTDMVDDQVNVVSRVFMGLTVGCARCHDHKFDPIPTADYYGLAGIFFSTTIATPQISPPWVHVPLATKAQIDRFSAYTADVAKRDADFKAWTDAQFAALPKRFAADTATYLLAAHDYETRPTAAAGQTAAQFAPSRKVRPDALAQWVEYLRVAPIDHRSLDVMARDADGLKGVIQWRSAEATLPAVFLNITPDNMAIPGALPARSVAVHPGPQDGVAVAWRSPIEGVVKITGTVAHAHPACGDGVAWALERCAPQPMPLASGDLPLGQKADIAAVGGEAITAVHVKPGELIRLVILPKANHSCDLTDIDLTISEQAGGTKTWNLARDLLADVNGKGNWQLLDVKSGGGVSHAEQGPQSALADWFAVSERAAAGKASREQLETSARAVQQAVDAMAAKVNAKTPAGRFYKDLTSERGPFRVASRDEALLPAESQVSLKLKKAELEALKKNAPPAPEIAMAAKDGGAEGTKYAGFNDCQIHIRGSYERLGDKVARHFPRIIAGDDQPPITQGSSGRLQLAEWIASPKHPLTARVMVNRIWQHHFGQGIVRTPGNFGKLGERPTNPELLDYLADRFVQSGWSIKSMHRLMMLSATYQQSSHADPATSAGDPENKLFGRMSVRRLEAESIRDTLLALAGRLDPTPGGRPPRDLALPRKSVYLMTVRSDKTGFWFLFDKADPEGVVDQRTTSTVAPQALFLLNGDFMAAQVGGLVDRLTKDKPDDAGRITAAYELLFGRPPAKDEAAVGEQFLKQIRAESNERQAWEQYAETLLCTNELIYVE